MSSAELLKNEIATTLSLGLGRGEDIDTIAADILHELLEAGTERIEEASSTFIRLRQAMKTYNPILTLLTTEKQHGDRPQGRRPHHRVSRGEASRGFGACSAHSGQGDRHGDDDGRARELVWLA